MTAAVLARPEIRAALAEDRARRDRAKLRRAAREAVGPYDPGSPLAPVLGGALARITCQDEGDPPAPPAVTSRPELPTSPDLDLLVARAEAAHAGRLALTGVLFPPDGAA
jgi:hypothetical protein